MNTLILPSPKQGDTIIFYFEIERKLKGKLKPVVFLRLHDTYFSKLFFRIMRNLYVSRFIRFPKNFSI